MFRSSVFDRCLGKYMFCVFLLACEDFGKYMLGRNQTTEIRIVNVLCESRRLLGVSTLPVSFLSWAISRISLFRGMYCTTIPFEFIPFDNRQG